MAATDQNYRSQRILDIVFAATCVLLLLSTVWMFADDFFKEWKQDQNTFNDADEAMDVLAGLRDVPSDAEVSDAEEAVMAARSQLKQDPEVRAAEKRVDASLPKKVAAEASFNNSKADYDSKMSLLNIETDKDPNSSRTQQLRQEVEQLATQLAERNREFEAAKAEYENAQRDLTAQKKPLSDAADKLNKLYAKADNFLKSAAKKHAGMGYSIRSLPVIDAFARPARIKQYVLDDLTIDYGTFKRVPRWDRCTTCHLGMEKPDFTKDNLRALAQVPEDAEQKLADVKKTLRGRKKALEAAGDKLQFDPDDLKLRPVNLVGKSGGEEDPKYVNEFCAHPRLDLFVGSNSPHPADKFGCTICHGGQGSATDFVLASHTPNNMDQKHRWINQRDWERSHFWDYPMLARRFTESTCLKCHYEVTDLIRDGTREEAPKVIRGYNLVREYGCFGCHEISGYKTGRRIGPDLRLEPSPPLEDLPVTERDKLTSDPTNPPGAMRKIGPTLRRLTEKTHENWVRHWIDRPRGFRPDTKMPHFYHLANNDPTALEGTGQESFPNTELQSIAHFLFFSSKNYLGEVMEAHKLSPDKAAEEQKRRDELLLIAVPNEQEKKELEELTRRIQLRATAEPIADLPSLRDYKADAGRGAVLFRERGCLACHTHETVVNGKDGQPAVKSEAHFGPNLSRLRAKLGDKPGDAKAHRWLVQWIKDPKVYHPRTFMPVTHLEDKEAADVAEYLLGDKVSQPWNPRELPEVSDESLQKLARVFLGKVLSPQRVEDLFSQDPDAQQRAQHYYQTLRGGVDRAKFSNEDALTGVDERLLAREGGVNRENLMLYIGKKAIGQLGCYGCHEVHGFEGAKPIGTPLNDWGKKDPERLAFEDIDAYVKAHFNGIEEGKEKIYEADIGGRPTTYEYFFFDLLEHRQREGFLNQKLLEPRSYDYKRIRTWDERLRMPQFNFSRQTASEDASPEQKTQVASAEAEAREAVMTFILGLVAEPVNSKYVYDPPSDRMAEVKGRQVIDKYNCYGCHQIRPGTYELNAQSPEVEKALQNAYRAVKSSFESDHRFPDHNAWAGLPQPNPAVYVVRAVSRVEEDPDNGKQILLTLTEALHKPGIGGNDKELEQQGFANDLPAYTTLVLPAANEEQLKQILLAHDEPFGGAFGDLLVQYLIAQDAKKPQVEQVYKDVDSARPAVPPQLFREGEKVQPAWLFRFLRNPIRIRPMARLRMPKFNMSDTEAMTLVNYFAAFDKTRNRGVDLKYPYLHIPQRDESYWEPRNREYFQRLGPNKIDERLKGLEDVWKADLDQLQVKDEAKKKQHLDTWKQEYREQNVYGADAFRLVANYQICLGCHQVGDIQPTNRAAQGPSLNLSSDRLRPDWTKRWVANPQRFLTFKTPMPQNFGRNVHNFQQFFEGPSIAQVEAVRDVLMDFPRVADLPANRSFRPKEESGGGK